MKAITVAIVLTACFFIQVFCDATCKGENDAFIFHVLDECFQPDEIGSEYLFSLSHNGSATVVVSSEYSPPSNCSSKTLKSSETFPLNQCVPDSLQPSNFLYFSFPSPNFTLPYTGAFTTSIYNDCSSTKHSAPAISRVQNPKFCMQFPDGTSAVTNCKNDKEYHDYYYDTQDCTGPYSVDTVKFSCQTGEQESCYLGAQNNPNKEYIIITSFINR